MSMILTLYRLSADDFNVIQQEPSELETLAYSGSYGSSKSMDLDKLWEALNYTLTGYALVDIAEMPSYPLLSQSIFGSRTIHEELDLGYGPASYVSQEGVVQIAASLNQISDDAFQAGFDMDKMDAAGIYPSIWKDKSQEALLKQELLDAFTELKAFYQQASSLNQVVVSVLS